MSTHTRTLDVKYLGETPVTVTVDGLPAQAADAVAKYAAQLTEGINRAAYERQAARRAAYRIAQDGHREAMKTFKPTEEQRLSMARKGELSQRPVTAEIAIPYPLAGKGATLRLYGANGQQVEAISLTEPPRWTRTPDPLSWYPGEITQGAMTAGLLQTAGYHLARKGFNYARGAQWAPYAGREGERKHRREWEFASAEYTTDGEAPYMARVALTPTADYLAYVEASYGPAPVLADLADIPEGWKVRRVQRGWWEITAAGRRYAITWRPGIGYERWGYRTEDHPDDESERFHGHADDAPGAVAALVAHLSA